MLVDALDIVSSNTKKQKIGGAEYKKTPKSEQKPKVAPIKATNHPQHPLLQALFQT